MTTAETMSERNRTAWEHRAYDFWLQLNGTPEKAGADMKADPRKWLRRHLDLMGDVKGRSIVVPLGSNGRKAVPLAVLGARVTVIDISRENGRYAAELAAAAGVSLEYVVADYASCDLARMEGSFDIAYMEGGILHYFPDLGVPFGRTRKLLKAGGQLVLNDFHPMRKCLPEGTVPTGGDYFDAALHDAPVAYEDLLAGADKASMPKCLLRYWTMGEIVTAVAKAGFRIGMMRETPYLTKPKLPGDFTIAATAEGGQAPLPRGGHQRAVD